MCPTDFYSDSLLDIYGPESMYRNVQFSTAIDQFSWLLGEVVKNGDIKCVYGEGMPTYRNPFEKGKLIIQFAVQFPERLDPAVAEKLEKILPLK